MSAQLPQRILSRAEELRDQMAVFLGDLVRIPSPSCHEEAVIKRIRREMEQVGFDEVRTDALGSVIGRIGRGPRVIAMDAHVDTVAVGNRDLWSDDPYSGAIRNDRVWGRGAADQKGGMAALVYAVKILKEIAGGADRPGGADSAVARLLNDCTLLVTGTVMEEDCDGLCWQHLIREDSIRPEVCVITEPTGCRVYRGQRGRMEIEVAVPGVSAHGSAPERGRNAIYRMSEVVQGIARLDRELPRDQFLGQGSVAVTRIEGAGPSLCAIPDQARIHLDRRLTWGETRESAMAEVERVLAGCSWWEDLARGGAAADSPEGSGATLPEGVSITVPEYRTAAYTGKVYPGEALLPAWKLAEDHTAVDCAYRTYRALFGADVSMEEMVGGGKWAFSTNGVAISGVHEIPCLGFGPGFEEQAHAPDEFCPLEHLPRAAAFYATYPLCYCA